MNLADQEVDPLRRLVARLAEHVALDLADVVLEPVDHGLVGLHGMQQCCLQHGTRSVLQHAGPVLQLVAHALERGGLSIAHGDDVVTPGVEEELAELDFLP